MIDFVINKFPFANHLSVYLASKLKIQPVAVSN